jgi:CheY-like chemotaxis protein
MMNQTSWNYRLILSHYEAEVSTAPTAVEGLEQVQKHRSNVIVSDISIPVWTATSSFANLGSCQHLTADNRNIE